MASPMDQAGGSRDMNAVVGDSGMEATEEEMGGHNEQERQEGHPDPAAPNPEVEDGSGSSHESDGESSGAEASPFQSPPLELATPASLPEGVCEECECDPSLWVCDTCEMDLCTMCFDVLHRKGKRALHRKRPRESMAVQETASSNGDGGVTPPTPPTIPHVLTLTEQVSSSSTGSSNSNSGAGSAPSKKSSNFPTFNFWSSSPSSSSSTSPPLPAHPCQLPPLGSSQSMRDRAKSIPLRLSFEQRKTLHLVQATLTACDYTARVDRHFKSLPHREQAQLKQITGVLQALVLSEDYAKGRALVEEQDYERHALFFQRCFEVARRHKIMNPEKMRGAYGKLSYLLQDALSPALRRHLHVHVVGRLQTVYALLEEKDGLRLLDDPLIHTATQEILPDKRKSRAQIQQEIKRKERAIETFVRAYTTPCLEAEDIRLCLYSICDNNSFLNSNRLPIDKMIAYLLQYFSSGKVEPGYSLSILQGQAGARLTHSHERQFNFALQSLTLWREITDDMFRFWCLAEEDLLSSQGPPYTLRDTGQGLHRVQHCPRTYHAMQDLLHKTQRRVGSWVGSSVIHLGDHNVPNALMFIDKYTQVPRILAPIVQCLEQIEVIVEEDEGVRNLVNRNYKGLATLKKDILYDFFKTAFDGSGGDNFYDAGSCIDGRLTSAWNWCSQLSSKPFYPIFKLTGFASFDSGVGPGG